MTIDQLADQLRGLENRFNFLSEIWDREHRIDGTHREFTDPLILRGPLRFLGLTESTANPTDAELPESSDLAVHRNTTSGAIFLAFNDAGTIVTVELTP